MTATRLDREDTSRQEQARLDARTHLAAALARLERAAREAKGVAESRARRPLPVEVTGVHAAYLGVQRAEEAHDLADYDLRTARGEDG